MAAAPPDGAEMPSGDDLVMQDGVSQLVRKVSKRMERSVAAGTDPGRALEAAVDRLRRLEAEERTFDHMPLVRELVGSIRRAASERRAGSRPGSALEGGSHVRDVVDAAQAAWEAERAHEVAALRALASEGHGGPFRTQVVERVMRALEAERTGLEAQLTSAEPPAPSPWPLTANPDQAAPELPEPVSQPPLRELDDRPESHQHQHQHQHGTLTPNSVAGAGQPDGYETDRTEWSSLSFGSAPERDDVAARVRLASIPGATPAELAAALRSLAELPPAEVLAASQHWAALRAALVAGLACGGGSDAAGVALGIAVALFEAAPPPERALDLCADLGGHVATTGDLAFAGVGRDPVSVFHRMLSGLPRRIAYLADDGWQPGVLGIVRCLLGDGPAAGPRQELLDLLAAVDPTASWLSVWLFSSASRERVAWALRESADRVRESVGRLVRLVESAGDGSATFARQRAGAVAVLSQLLAFERTAAALAPGGVERAALAAACGSRLERLLGIGSPAAAAVVGVERAVPEIAALVEALERLVYRPSSCSRASECVPGQLGRLCRSVRTALEAAERSAGPIGVRLAAVLRLLRTASDASSGHRECCVVREPECLELLGVVLEAGARGSLRRSWATEAAATWCAVWGSVSAATAALRRDHHRAVVGALNVALAGDGAKLRRAARSERGSEVWGRPPALLAPPWPVPDTSTQPSRGGGSGGVGGSSRLGAGGRSDDAIVLCLLDALLAMARTPVGVLSLGSDDLVAACTVRAVRLWRRSPVAERAGWRALIGTLLLHPAGFTAAANDGLAETAIGAGLEDLLDVGDGDAAAGGLAAALHSWPCASEVEAPLVDALWAAAALYGSPCADEAVAAAWRPAAGPLLEFLDRCVMLEDEGARRQLVQFDDARHVGLRLLVMLLGRSRPLSDAIEMHRPLRSALERMGSSGQPLDPAVLLSRDLAAALREGGAAGEAALHADRLSGCEDARDPRGNDDDDDEIRLLLGSGRSRIGPEALARWLQPLVVRRSSLLPSAAAQASPRNAAEGAASPAVTRAARRVAQWFDCAGPAAGVAEKWASAAHAAVAVCASDRVPPASAALLGVMLAASGLGAEEGLAAALEPASGPAAYLWPCVLRGDSTADAGPASRRMALLHAAELVAASELPRIAAVAALEGSTLAGLCCALLGGASLGLESLPAAEALCGLVLLPLLRGPEWSVYALVVALEHLEVAAARHDRLRNEPAAGLSSLVCLPALWRSAACAVGAAAGGRDPELAGSAARCASCGPHTQRHRTHAARSSPSAATSEDHDDALPDFLRQRKLPHHPFCNFSFRDRYPRLQQLDSRYGAEVRRILQR